MARPDGAARDASGDARRPCRLLRGRRDARRPRCAAHRRERERRRLLRLPRPLAGLAGRPGRSRGAGRAERAPRTRRLRLAPRRRAPRRLLVGRVPRPDRGNRGSRSHALRRRDLNPGLDDRIALEDARTRRRRPPAGRHPHTGVLWQRRRSARRVGEDHVRSLPGGALARLPDQVDDALQRSRSWAAETGCDRRHKRDRVRQRPCLGGRARGGAAPQGGLGNPCRGCRDPRGSDVDDDGAPTWRSRAEPPSPLR